MPSHRMVKFLILSVSLIVAIPSAVNAEIVRCKGETHWGGLVSPVRIDVVLPESRDLLVILSDREAKLVEIVTGGQRVGNGTIEVKYGDREPTRFSFVMTGSPDKRNSLVGFYVGGNYPMVLRADLWAEGKPFTFYNSWENELIKGRCE